MGPAKLQPALLGGIVMGVLSVLPFVNLLNGCCCAWVLFGGGLAAYLMQQNHPAPITAGDGAIVGLLAGVVGAVVCTVLSIPMTMMMGPFQAELIERVLETARDMPPEARSILEGLRGGPASVGLGIIGIIFSFFVMLVVGSVFGLIGGLLGALIFRKNEPPYQPPPPPMGFEPPTFTPPTFTPPPPPVPPPPAAPQ